MPSIPAEVVPELLVWARKNANYERLALARKVRVDEALIEQWELGKAQPTITQLRAIAKVCNRPLALFFLAEPPNGFDALRDFRRFDLTLPRPWSPALHVEYRRALLQRDAVLDIAELELRVLESRWRIAAAGSTDLAIAKALRKMLVEVAPIDPPTPAADEYRHLGYWTTAAEEAGVLVITTGGGKVPTKEMRAFSMYFEEVPVVALNGADWPRGRLFSLVHELAHLALNTSGLCDTSTDRHPSTADRWLEARCNAIAAEVLMPSAAVLASQDVRAHQVGEHWSIPEIASAARPFGVSVEAFLRRLATLSRVPIEYYEAFRDSQPEEIRRRDKRGKPTYYQTKVRDLGKGYVRTVSGAYERAVIDTSTATGYLGAKVGQIERLAKAARLT